MLSRFKHQLNRALTHQGFRRYFANTSWMFGEQILRMVAGLLVGIWVARYLGPEQFGVFSYATAFVAIFSSIAKLGLDGIVVRDLVNEPYKRDVYLGTAFWLKLVGALSMLTAIAIATLFTSNDRATNLYIFIIAGGIIFQAFEVVDFYFQSKVLSKFVSICKITQLLFSSLLKIYFVLTGADLFWFVIVSLIDQITLAATFYIAYKYQKLGGFYSHFDWDMAKKMLKDSWPLIFSGLVIAIYMRIDQVMIKEMLGEKEVGLYSAAVRLTEVWYFIPTLITSSLFPAIVNAKKVSESLFYSRLQKLYDLMMFIALMLAIPITFLSEWIIVLLYGKAYIQAASILSVFVWTGPLVFLGLVNARFFMVKGLNRVMLYFTTCCCTLNIVANYLLIPHYGIMGAAISTLLAQAFGLPLNILYKPARIAFFMQIRSFAMLTLIKGSIR